MQSLRTPAISQTYFAESLRSCVAMSLALFNTVTRKRCKASRGAVLALRSIVDGRRDLVTGVLVERSISTLDLYVIECNKGIPSTLLRLWDCLDSGVGGCRLREFREMGDDSASNVSPVLSDTPNTDKSWNNNVQKWLDSLPETACSLRKIRISGDLRPISQEP